VPLSQGAGIICFPSFHVIWAILCAAALWGFRPLRIPIALLSGTIVVSTMTTGWHYFSDVLAGVVIAVLAIAIAKVYAV
jgi:membrane-associated phospholipid phosphatase